MATSIDGYNEEYYDQGYYSSNPVQPYEPENDPIDFSNHDNPFIADDEEDSIWGRYYSSTSASATDTPRISYFSTTSTDLDGNIDASEQSNYRGDCWFLTGLNTASYSEEGRQAIRDAMTVNEDGSVSITFKGVGVTYTITPEQIAAANNSAAYSSGDDDVLVFEIATEQLRNDIAAGKIEFDVTSPYYVSDTTNQAGKTSMDGGFVEQVWYLLTGKLSEHTSNPAEVDSYLTKFEQNPDSTAMSCSFKGGRGDTNGFTTKDVNGNEVTLYFSHAYGVKSVDGNTVTIVNPWDSSQEIVLDRNTFCQYANLSYCDLSDANEDQSGLFSKITGTLSGFVDSIREMTGGIVDGFMRMTGLKDPVDAKKSSKKGNNAQGGAGALPPAVSNYIIAMVEEYHKGQITHDELMQIVESVSSKNIDELRATYHF